MTEDGFEIIPSNVSRQDIIDESNKRLSRAGYCSRSGEPLKRTKIMNNAPTEQYRRNYDKIKWES